MHMHNFVKNAHMAETIAYFKHTSMHAQSAVSLNYRKGQGFVDAWISDVSMECMWAQPLAVVFKHSDTLDIHDGIMYYYTILLGLRQLHIG